MAGPADPFDTDDTRFERLGEHGDLLREGGQLLVTLGNLPSLTAAESALRGLDDRQVRVLAIAALMVYKGAELESDPAALRAWRDG